MIESLYCQDQLAYIKTILMNVYLKLYRLQVNKVYDIDARRVSVWGDEKKTFNIALWYKNEYDKK